jgi:hypothetical protein
MKAQIVEQIELFSGAELQSLEFVPEELEAIEAERVPDLDSITFEDIAGNLEAALEGNAFSRPRPFPINRLPPELKLQIMQHMTWERYQALKRVMNLPDPLEPLKRRMMANSIAATRRR